MEVAASLPNVLKVFPLRIMVREDFPAFQQEAFSSEVAVEDADEATDEGEIDLNNTCRYEEAHGISNLKSEVNSSSATPAALRSPPLSILANGSQLERSVDALLLFPDKFSSQGNQRPSSKIAQGESALKQAHAPSPGQASLSVTHLAKLSAAPTQFSPVKLSAAPTQSSALNLPQACILPQVSSSLSSPSKLIKASLPAKKLHVLSPEAKQSQISPTADNDLQASSPLKASSLPFKASSLRVDQPHAHPPAGNFSPRNHHLMPSLSKLPTASPASQAPLVASAEKLFEGLPQSHAQASSALKYHHQAPSGPKNHSYSSGSVLGKEPQVNLGLTTSVQLSHQTSPPVMTPGHGTRPFITHVNGNMRPKSSAVRDYPEGCGRNVSNKIYIERDIPNVCHDKVGFKMQAVKDRGRPDHVLTSPTKQVRKDQKLGAHQEGNPQCPVQMLEDISALCVYKSLKTSVPLPNPQKIHMPLKRKHDSRKLPDFLPHQAQKKLKVRQISRILNSVEGKFLSSTPQDKKIQIDYLPDSNYDRSASVERVAKVQDGKSCKGKPARGVMFAKQLSKHLEVVDSLLPIEVNSGVCARSLVKKTLQEFDCVRRSLAICKDRHQRPDLAAAKILKNKGRWRNCENGKIVGDVPGVEVGDQFSFRIEMLVIGLHRQVQGGIDYISGTQRPHAHGPLATSIVASGGYEDDDDYGDTFIYTGQGGNNYKGDRRQACDQVLERGNLALSNSCKEKTPVRVIRGSTDDKFYTYDGLYDVVDYWFQTGVAGFGVYQFKLSRRPGQPELGSSIVRFVGTVKKKGLARPHLLMGDLSHGKEGLPICVVNEVDDEVAPQYFSYIPKMKYPSWYCPKISKGCDCVGGCVDASKCACAAKNGGEFPYNEYGQIVRGKKVVFECGQSCACSSSCHNRVSQRGPKHMLEVFKTRKRGWGVRSLEPIRPGDFICEYVGELLSDADAEQRIERDEYLFDIGNKTSAWSDVSDLMGVTMEKAIVPVVEDAGYAIDARLFGSVARFINHSCSPNLFAQNVVYDGDDLRFPHVMLFSMENIPPMRELSYDYNYTIGHVRDANGNVKSKACYCGAQDCRGRLY